MLKNINLEHYPAHRTHYLAYALQFGQKPPSVTTMNRCEKRNQAMMGVDKADKVIGRVKVFKRNMHKRFEVPPRYLKNPFRGMRVYGFKRRRKVGKNKKEKKAYVPGKVFPPRKPIAIPGDLVKKVKKLTSPKEREKIFTIHSADWIQLKAERSKFMEEI